MKKLVLFLLAVTTTLQSFSNSSNDLLVTNSYYQSFKKAYILNPTLPKGILESVAFTQSRFTHLNDTQEPSCIGYPKAYGIMGLTENGQNYFRNNLILVSQLSGYSIDDIKADPEKNILAYAKAFTILQQQLTIYGENIADYKDIFVLLSELPLVSDLQNDFAMNAHLYQLYWFLTQGDLQDYYSFPDYGINLKTVFGNNYDVLSSKHVYIAPDAIYNSAGGNYTFTNSTNFAISTVDYPNALWNPTTCNYSSRAGIAITMVAIHDVEGSYAGCISWFKNCSANASAHYVIRSSDGQITQMVAEASKAWHIGSENPYTLGIEHEGYNNSAIWYTTAMLTSSADLVRDMCARNGINKQRCYFGPGCSGTTQQCSQGPCIKIKGHQMFPNQTHNDPGPFWNWEKFYKLINNTHTITTIATTNGNFYDSGGATAQYSNDERKLWLFQPSGGATSVSMNFTTFDLENKSDVLLLYDGNSVNSPLIGKYTNTVSPGNINSTSPNLLIEFRSDCATTKEGWSATYTSNNVPTSNTDNIAPTSTINPINGWQTSNFSASYTDADNAGGSGISKRFYQVMDFDGTEWRANAKRGFFSDNFNNVIHPEWTQASGNWNISNNALQQTLQTTTMASNTNIYAALNQTISTSSSYLYHFKGKIGGTGTNRRAGLHFFADNPNLPNRGNSYFVYFRLDGPRVQIYKTVNDVVSIPYADSSNNVSINANQWYDFKIVFNRASGKIDVYKDNTLAATWTDSAPFTNGNYISFRSGDCTWSLDEVKTYRSRTTTNTAISISQAATSDVRFQNPNPLQSSCEVRTIVSDVASNLSAVEFEDINIDWTVPSNITSVRDGKEADISIVQTKDSLSANWPESIDVNSAIARYWYSIGNQPGIINVLAWTSNWSDTIATAKNLNLKHDTIYYFNVKAENGAGLFSPIITSNGQKVDTNTALISVRELAESYFVNIYPNPFKQSFEVSLSLTKEAVISITLVDVLGRELKYYNSTNREPKGLYKHTINTSDLNLSSGMYWIKIKVANDLLCKKIIKQ